MNYWIAVWVAKLLRNSVDRSRGILAVNSVGHILIFIEIGQK